MKQIDMKRNGFTLVELLVVIAIIGVLVALLLPAVQAAREAARRTQCKNQLRQLALASVTYHDALGHLPTAGDEVIQNSENQATGLSWLAQILPFIENNSLSDIVDQSAHWSAAVNDQAEQTVVKAFVCPTTGSELSVFTAGSGNTTQYVEFSELRSHYVGIMGASSACAATDAATNYPETGYTMLLRNEGVGASGGLASNGSIVVNKGIRFKEITDGSSNTMMLGESSWDSGPTRTWIVGTLDHNSYSSTGAGANHGWLYNSKNVRWPMHTAFREKPDEDDSGYRSNDISLGSRHPGGAHVAMGDASVHFIAEDIELRELKAMATRANEDDQNPALTCNGGGGPPPPGR